MLGIYQEHPEKLATWVKLVKLGLSWSIFDQNMAIKNVEKVYNVN